MVKSKQSPKFLVGYRYNDNQLPKEKVSHNRKPSKFLKSILRAGLMDKRKIKGYIQCKVIFRKNKLPITKFYQSSNGLPIYTQDINRAILTKKKPHLHILDPDTSFRVRHFIVEVPYNEFRKSNDKLKTLLDYHPGRLIFEHLTNQLINKRY